MNSSARGYWVMTWLGLLSNVIALPLIAWFAFLTPPEFRVANISVSFALAWPAAVVGIVASAGLLAQRRWGGIVAIVALSMALAVSLPYAMVRLALHHVGADALPIGGLALLMAVGNLAALLYWCRPSLRRGGLL